MEEFRIREFIGNLSWIFCSPSESKGVHEAAVISKKQQAFSFNGKKAIDTTLSAERSDDRGRELNALQIRRALQISNCPVRILSGDKAQSRQTPPLKPVNRQERKNSFRAKVILLTPFAPALTGKRSLAKIHRMNSPGGNPQLHQKPGKGSQMIVGPGEVIGRRASRITMAFNP